MQQQDQTPPANDQTKTTQRYTVHEAAMLLGLSVEAVRKRAERGKLAKERDPDGTVYVLLDIDQPKTGQDWSKTGHSYGDTITPDADQTDDQTKELLEVYRDQVEFLRRELATRDEEIHRRDAILMSMSEGLKALNPPPERRDGHEASTILSPGVNPQGDDVGQEKAKPSRSRSWLYRFFFGQ